MASAFVGVLTSAIFASAARSAIGRVDGFGSNPGALGMLLYAPQRLAAGRPLVVLLHGCRQGAAEFAVDAGWLALAQQYRLALLLPEQSHKNNTGRCFNWFRPEDSRRGAGEAMSIRQMVRAATRRLASDPKRIFVVGFSAGGGMTAALLAAYPATFAAGAVVAGMPVGSAGTPARALLRMRRADRHRSRAALAQDVRAVTGTATRRAWPRLTIWQGERDQIVDPGNALVLAAQWGAVQGLGAEPLTDQVVAGVRRRGWGKPNRPATVELWTIAALGHGFPVDARQPGGGRPGAWVTDAGISGARQMANFWGLEPPRR